MVADQPFQVPEGITLCTSSGSPTAFDLESSPKYVPILPQRRHDAGVVGAIIRNPGNQKPVIVAFGFDSAPAVSIICVYQETQAEDPMTLSMAAIKKKALRRGPGTVLSPSKSRQSNKSLITYGDERRECLSLSFTITITDDVLVCNFKVRFTRPNIGPGP